MNKHSKTSRPLWVRVLALLGPLTPYCPTCRDPRQLSVVVQALTTSMTDAQRMSIIVRPYKSIRAQYQDMEQFTTENQILSLRRSKDMQEVFVVKQLYGLE